MTMEMGIGPNNTSLLHKLGRLQAWEMTDDQLLEMITREQTRRSFQRTVGRTLRMAKDHPSHPKPTLESLGLHPDIITRLRASGVKEELLIAQIRKAGLL